MDKNLKIYRRLYLQRKHVGSLNAALVKAYVKVHGPQNLHRISKDTGLSRNAVRRALNPKVSEKDSLPIENKR